MVIITIDSGVYCRGDETAVAVAARQGAEVLTDEQLVARAAERFGAASKRLRRALDGNSSFFSSGLRDRPRLVACLRATLSEALGAEKLVYLGKAGHLAPRTLTNVLRVCLGGTQDYRLAEAERRGVPRKAAMREIGRDDLARAQWTEFLFELGPWDKSLYDVFIAMQESTPEEAVDSICAHAARPVLAARADARTALEAFRLAARVNLRLAEEGHDVDVACSDGAVDILIKGHTIFLERLEKTLVELALEVPGVRQATARPGPRFQEPSLGFAIDLEVPSKVLLVDDEKEFVHTLSERLQSRSMEPAIAYDGEQALDLVAQDEPEVMVLDLKMPGIDGIEVLRRVKQSHPATEVIILTGHGSDEEERLSAELGAFAYLRKPVDIEVLTKTMKDAYRKVSHGRTSPASG